MLLSSILAFTTVSGVQRKITNVLNRRNNKAIAGVQSYFPRLQAWTEDEEIDHAVALLKKLVVKPNNADPEELVEIEANVVEAIDKKLKVEDYQGAFEIAKTFIDEYSHEKSFEIAHRYVSAGYEVSNILKKSRSPTDSKRLEVLSSIVKLSKSLVESYPGRAIAHKFYAICGQEITNHQGTREKILGGLLFEKHTRIAIELEPTDPTCHYMLGRFLFQVAKLSWSERMAAKAIFGNDPPSASFQDALDCFTKAASLRPSGASLEDQLEIANCYVKLANKSQAKMVLQSMMDTTENDDLLVDAKDLLESLS